MLHFVRSRWHLLHAFQFAWKVNSAITFIMQSPRAAITGKICSYLACTQWHKRNFAVKCEGDCLVWNQYITKPKEKTVATWHIIFPLSEKVGGRVPRVPHLIAPMLNGVKFLARSVLPDKKFYSNCLYWCKYVRDFDGATQWLKATVPDRRVWPYTCLCYRKCCTVEQGT